LSQGDSPEAPAVRSGAFGDELWAWAQSEPGGRLPPQRRRRCRFKGKISPLIYLFGIIGSLLWVWFGIAAYVLVAAIWLIPDRRMEHYIDAHQEPPAFRP
jgi:hypothetical protein